MIIMVHRIVLVYVMARSYEDECGTCDSDATNDCEQDCAGVWGGDAVMAIIIMI